MPASPSPEVVTLGWRLPVHVSALVDQAAAARAMTRRAFLTDAVQEWVSDLPQVEAEVQAMAEFHRPAKVPDEVLEAVRLHEAAGNAEVLGVWAAFMLMARWPVDVLAETLGVPETWIVERGAAGRATMSAGRDLRAVTALVPAVVDPPDWLAVPAKQMVSSGEDSVRVRAQVDPQVKGLYERKRALLGLGSSQAGYVLLVDAARAAGVLIARG